MKSGGANLLLLSHNCNGMEAIGARVYGAPQCGVAAVVFGTRCRRRPQKKAPSFGYKKGNTVQHGTRFRVMQQ